MSFKLAISAGHYLKTQKGCIKALDPNETREWVLNDRIADKLEDILKKYDGIEVLRLDDTNGIKDVTNAERAQKANEWGADLYLAVHHNAAGGDGKPHNASGICAFVYTNPSSKSVEWAQALYDASIKHTGLKGNRSQAIWKANFEEVRAPKMPAVLMENGFMDSPTDVPIILSEEYADGIAKAYAEVVVAKSGAVLKPAETPTSTSNEVAVTLPILSKNSKGEAVKTLQRLLNAVYCRDAIAVDGSFGTATLNALKAYQKANGLEADGVCGPATWSVLLK